MAYEATVLRDLAAQISRLPAENGALALRVCLLGTAPFGDRNLPRVGENNECGPTKKQSSWRARDGLAPSEIRSHAPPMRVKA